MTNGIDALTLQTHNRLRRVCNEPLVSVSSMGIGNLNDHMLQRSPLDLEIDKCFARAPPGFSQDFIYA